MTKEELEKEAEDVVYGMGYDTYESDGHSDFAVQDILVKFAEPREKRIAELEEKLEQTEKDFADYQFNYPTIKELEKENAELKLKLEALEGQTPWKDIKDKSEIIGKLTKAKEIISEWEDSFCCGADYLYLGSKGEELRIKSQKFLNSEVKK